MNTRLGKSFGLAFVVAVGILALMLALGTFNAQKVGAQEVKTVSVQPDSVAAGTTSPLTVGFQVDTNSAVTSGSEIKIDLPGFILPSTIAASSVSIRGGGGAGIPASVTVSEQTVTVEVGNDSDGVPMFVAGGADAQVYITFTRASGIAAGDTAGKYFVQVNGTDETKTDGSNEVTIRPSLTLSHSEGSQSTVLKVSGSSYPPGKVTIYVTSKNESLANPTGVETETVSGGAFEVTVTIDIVPNDAAKFEYGDNYIQVDHDVDTNEVPPTPQKFVLSAKVSAPEQLTRGNKNVEVKVTEGKTNVVVAGVTIGGTGVPFAPKARGTADQLPTEIMHGDETKSERTLIGGAITLLIDVDNVKAGTDVTLAVNATTAKPEKHGSTKVDVVSLALNLSPPTAVVGQEVTVTGSGFDGKVAKIKIGSATVCDTEDKCDADVASGGRIATTFHVLNHVALADDDDYEVEITDNGGRIGTGTLTIPERVLTVSPEEGRIGSTVTLNGTAWPSATGASLVRIYYDDNQLTTATANSAGAWSASIEVPNTAGVGAPHDVEAKATVGVDDLNTDEVESKVIEQKVSHKTPDAALTVSPAMAQRGGTVTVSGQNFHTFRPVTIIIGGSDVTPSPAPTTDGDGSFSARVLVPGIDLGNQTLRVSVNEIPVVEFLEIVATPVSTTMASADVFAELVTADNLIVVWHFDNTTKDWSFYDPRPAVAGAVDLKMVSTGDNVWVQITADQMFQGEMLTAGWNLVTLD